MLTPKQHSAKQSAKNYFLTGVGAVAATLGGVNSAPISENIIGVGIGAKITDGTIVGNEAVRVYVRAKIPNHQLTQADKIPSNFDGFPTDVIEVGQVTAQVLQSWQRFGKHRPTSCGVSVGHLLITAGTLGCLVEKDGVHYILSNNHVLANCNNANLNDIILQPGRSDGGSSPNDQIATLSDFKPLDFTGAPNHIDAAIAKVGDRTQTIVEPEIIDIGRAQTTTKPALCYQSVRKHGRTTGHTIGVVTDLSADLWVGYGTSGRAWFEDQLAITGIGSKAFSQLGDSGSLIVDAVSLHPVALLFAEGNGLTIANPIDLVLNHFNVIVV